MSILKPVDPSRRSHLQDEFEKEYFTTLEQLLLDKHQQWEGIYPPLPLVFNAFDKTPFESVKVVILGQDPYHGPWQAHGLSFSVPEWVAHPPSLRNIFKEMHTDLWASSTLPASWELTYLAQQWVFLLNSILTVTAWQPASHRKLWRERFTDTVLRTISEHKEWVVFVLRWAYARSKRALIDQSRHTILEAPHPSPLSSYRWFFGSQPFSTINSILESQWQTPINRLNTFWT